MLRRAASRWLVLVALALCLGALASPTAALAVGPEPAFDLAASQPAGNRPVAMIAADFDHDGRDEVLASNQSGTTLSLYGNEQGSVLETPTLLDVPSGPRTAVAVDLNRDGNLDIAVACGASNVVGVLLGHGDGTFAPCVTSVICYTPVGLASADMDRDGKMDLLVASQDEGGVYVVYGDGNGGFSHQAGYPSGGDAESVAVADLNADGWPDAAVTSGFGFVGVLLNNGSGGLNSRVAYLTTGGSTMAVRARDMDRDGDIDLVSANNAGTGSPGTVFLNDGTGVFSDKIAIGDVDGSVATNLELGDVNDDGILDIALTDVVGNHVRVFCGSGDSHAAEAIGVRQSLEAPSGLLFADLDRDGLLDLGSTSWTTEGQTRIWRNTTDVDRGLGFTSAETTVGGNTPTTTDSGDFDRDGNPDLVVCDLGSAGTGAGATVVFGNGTGGIRESKFFSAGTSPSCAQFADINRDGWLDIVLADRVAGKVWVMYGNKTGGVSGTGAVNATSPIWIDTGDLNGDGAPDAVVSSWEENSVQLLMNDGGGNLTVGPSLAMQAGAGSSTAVKIADLNRDGRPDIMSTNVGGGPTVWLGQAGGTFADAVGFGVSLGGALPAVTQGVGVADFDGDGKLDIAVSYRDSNFLRVYFGNGSGTTFPTVKTYTTPDAPQGVVIADMNRDGRPDIVVAHQGDHQESVYLNAGARAFAQQPAVQMGAGAVNTPCVVDFNRDGTPDLAQGLRYSGKVAIARGAPTATPGTLRGTVTVNGNPQNEVTVQVDSLPVVYTAPDGTYSVPFLVPGTHTVTFSRTNYSARTFDDITITKNGTTVQDVAMVYAPVPFHGTVHEKGTGTPLGGVTITVGSVATTVTAADGTFMLPSIPPDTYTVTFAKPGYVDFVASHLTISVASGAYDPDLEIAPAVLKGVVTRAGTSTGIVGVYVRVGGQLTSTDVDGSYTLWDIPEGVHDIEYYKADFATQTVSAVTFSRATTVTQDVALVPLAETVTAVIDAPAAGAVTVGSAVNFAGHLGSDSFGHAASTYAWRSSISGALSTNASFSTSALPVGVHTIYFKVQCENGAWSPEASVVVDVRKRGVTLSMPKVSGKASASKGTTFVGTVSPGRRVRVTLEVQLYSKKKTYKKLYVYSAASGSYRYKYKLKKGTYRVRALTATDGTWLAGTSGWRKVVVK